MDEEPDWYLREWMAHFEKRQASLVNELGWEKSRASEVWHGSRPYRRPVVNEIASWLGLQPYELLMPPAEALRLRELREAAFAIAANHPIAAERGRSFKSPPAPKPPAKKAS